MKKLFFVVIFLNSVIISAQITNDTIQNTADRLLAKNPKSPLTIGGYGEINYNQPEADNGELDVQRLVLMFGYKFINQCSLFIFDLYVHAVVPGPIHYIQCVHFMAG